MHQPQRTANTGRKADRWKTSRDPAMTFSNRHNRKMRYAATMRYTPTKSFILTALLGGDGQITDLWAMACKALGKEIPASTFYDAIYALRDDGLLSYQSRQISDRQMASLMKELAGGPIAEDVPVEGVGQVSLTLQGRAQAELLALKELIPASHHREAAQRIQRLQRLFDAVGQHAHS